MTARKLVTLGMVGLLAAAGSALATIAPAQAASGGKGCDETTLAKPARAADVARSNPAAFKKAEKRNAKTVPGLAEKAAKDRSLWLDRCGAVFYADAGPSAGERADAAATMGAAVVAEGAPLAGVPLTDTFLLNSKPGSARTIYLDFKGGTVSGTAWNVDYGSTVSYEPYSIDGIVDTNFSDAELTEIQKVWQVVSEDYAPFDVNVTTQDPGAAAIDRTSASDLVYGTRAAITNGGVIYTDCGCGGVAYVGVFNTAGSQHAYYQPAWVFSNGTTKNGKYIGEATSHEVGHNFGLNHDGTSTSGYYSGSSPWAPIMGASYSQPVSQWSKGEYPGANNTQDDLTQLATGAAVRPDEDTAGPLALANGGTLDGIVTRSTDVDSYAFTAAGPTTVSVGLPAFPDLDVQLTIADSTGTTVAVVNPATVKVSAVEASGMNAAATFDAPVTGAAYTARVQGAGQGTVPNAGAYSAYGSLGNYQVALVTQPAGEPTPLVVSVGSMPNGTVGSAYSSSPVAASGGIAPYTYAASGLPAGLSINAGTGVVSGTPSAAGSYAPSFTVTDKAGTSASQSGAVTVNATPVAVANQSATGTVGTALSKQVVATGGTGSFTWAATSGTVPPGLGFSAGGLLSGTPTAAGTFTFSATATSGGVSGTGTVTVTIAAAPVAPYFVTASALPGAKRYSAYSTTITVAGGTPGYTWTKVTGAVPKGMTLTFSGATATIKGTPSQVGAKSVTLRVTDSKGATVTRAFTINVVR